MCISNGLDAGLISNAVWKGFPLRDLLDQAVPLSGARRVRLQASIITPTPFRWRKRWTRRRCWPTK